MASKAAQTTGPAAGGTPTLSRLGSGRPLSPALASRMTGALGGDFSGVRVHIDPPAARAAKSVDANAFTVGQHVYFGAGTYQPGAPAGDRLLAHELVHTMQQGNGVPAPGAHLTVSQPGDVEEVEAHRLGDQATRPGLLVAPAKPAPRGPRVQRSPRTTSVGPRIARWAVGSGQEEASSTPQTEPAPAHTGPGWTVESKVGVVRVEEDTATLRGARLRPQPDALGPHKDDYVTLDEGTHVQVVSTQHGQNNQGWRYVIVTDGGYAGRAGYVKEYLILTDLPDPQAVEYYISTPNLKLQWLVQNHKHFEDYDITTGDDARTLAMAVYMANHERGRDGVYLNQEKLREAKDPGFWEGAKDKFDEYRRVLRPIFQAVELKLGEKIWLPGPAYVARLKDLNIVPTRPAWKNAAIMFGKAAAGFVSGVVQGFVGSIVDMVVGIWDLIKTVFTTVRDLFTGELFRKGREMYDAVTKYLDSKTPGEVLSDLLNALSTAAGEMWTNFVRRWTASNLFDKWNFRGRVIGYLAAEILMAVFSGGASLVAKLLSRLGKVGKVIAEILAKILKAIDKVLDAIPGRKLFKKEGGKHGHSKDSKGKQLPFAMAAGAVIAETNDRVDTPIPLLKAALWLLKAKYKWITGFEADRRGPGTYAIYMLGSRHLVDPHYTTKGDAPGDAPGQAAGAPTRETVEEFKKRGGKVQEVPEGVGTTKRRGLQPDEVTARPKDVSPADELRAMGEGPQSSSISEGSKARIGAAARPKHHVLPQEHRKWFERRGFKGDYDIDKFTLELPHDVHAAIHGGADWKLARKAWDREWNKAIMARLRAAQRRKGKSLLTREEVLKEAKAMIKQYPAVLEELKRSGFVPYRGGK